MMGLELKHGSGVRLNHVYTPLATSVAVGDDERDGRGHEEHVVADEDATPAVVTLDVQGSAVVFAEAPA